MSTGPTKDREWLTEEQLFNAEQYRHVLDSKTPVLCDEIRAYKSVVDEMRKEIEKLAKALHTCALTARDAHDASLACIEIGQIAGEALK